MEKAELTIFGRSRSSCSANERKQGFRYLHGGADDEKFGDGLAPDGAGGAILLCM